jgi:hypothetical protein
VNSSRAWTAGAVVAIVAIFGAAGALGVQPHLAAAAAADRSAQATVAQNSATGIEITKLSRAAATQSTLEARDARLEAAVPPGLRINLLSQMLRDTASLDNVSIEAFTPTTPVVYSPPLTSVAPVAAATPAPTATPAAAPAPAAVAPDAKSGWFGKTDPLVTPANFTVVPLSVTVKGSASDVVAFATDAQRQPRLFAATTFTTTRNVSDGSTTGVLAGYVYTLYAK